MKHTIAVIEDDTTISEILERALTEDGFEVVTAQDGISGVELVLEHKPSLVILDVVLPEMDGVAVVQELKKSEESKHIPIIVMTSLSGSREVAQAMDSGANEYLVKGDWNMKEVLRKVREHLGEKS